MAGIKITDLTALSVAEPTDYLCIVDVSDTSQSPAGTTKKIELGNIVESGTWTPTLDGEFGGSSNVALTKAQYSKVGNIVNCTITGTLDLDCVLNVDGGFDFTYPFAPSTNNSIGTCGVRNFSGQINTYVRNNTITFESISGISSSVTFFAIFQYEID